MGVPRAMRVWLLAAGLMLGGRLAAQTPVPPPRVVWLTAEAIGSPETVSAAVSSARKAGVAALVAPDDAHQDDAVRQALADGRAAGLKVFAAVQTFDAAGDEGAPERLIMSRAGVRDAHSLDPGSPEARKEVRDRVLAAARRSGIDGILLTGLAYPSRDAGFSDGDLAQFRTVTERELTREQKDALSLLPERDVWTRMFPARWARWRRDNVTGFLQGIYRDIKAERPGLQVAVAVSVAGPPRPWEAADPLTTHAQDIPGWKALGVPDAILLQRAGGLQEFTAWLRAATEAPGTAAIWRTGSEE